MFLVNIAGNVTWFINSFFTISGTCIDILKSFSFGGFNFFDILLALMIIPVGLAVTVATMRGTVVRTTRERR